MTANEYEIRFQFILATEMGPKEKDAMLSNLMKDMELFYQIPEVITEKWETENPEICMLHRKVASKRLMNFEE